MNGETLTVKAKPAKKKEMRESTQFKVHVNMLTLCNNSLLVTELVLVLS